VRPLPDIFPRRTYGVMTRRGKFLSHQAKRFIELMKPDFFDTDDSGPGHNLAVNENVFIAAQ
jgi:hypothetical protein